MTFNDEQIQMSTEFHETHSNQSNETFSLKAKFISGLIEILNKNCGSIFFTKDTFFPQINATNSAESWYITIDIIEAEIKLMRYNTGIRWDQHYELRNPAFPENMIADIKRDWERLHAN